jgi:hypothetical protein
VKALGVDATAIDGKVVDFYGKLAKVEHTRGGYVEWLYLNKTTPAGTPLPDPRGDSCSVLVGQRVKAKWPYSKTDTYLARVGEVYGKMARVVYSDDGKLQWSPCEELDPVF